MSPTSDVGMLASEIMLPRDDEAIASWERCLKARCRHAPFHDMVADLQTPRGRITVSVSD
jgi:hypothetical protein